MAVQAALHTLFQATVSAGPVQTVRGTADWVDLLLCTPGGANPTGMSPAGLAVMAGLDPGALSGTGSAAMAPMAGMAGMAGMGGMGGMPAAGAVRGMAGMGAAPLLDGLSAWMLPTMRDVEQQIAGQQKFSWPYLVVWSLDHKRQAERGGDGTYRSGAVGRVDRVAFDQAAGSADGSMADRPRRRAGEDGPSG